MKDTASRQGGRANRHNPSSLEGERGKRVFPRRQQMALRAAALRLHCPDRGSPTGEAANTPTGGRRFSGHLTNSDVYWRLLDALPHRIPGQGRPPGLSGG